MRVKSIVLHPTSEAQLDDLLRNPSHAVLFAGAKGSGKTYVAKTLAQQLLNQESLENYAYFRTIAPEKDSISIEQIRNLISFFRLKVPGKATIRRVAIIQDAETMGIEAQNALLKLLEEPPTDSVLILTSSRAQTLLSTIRSRVQLLQLPNPDRESLTKHFTSRGHETAAITSALLRSNTNIAEANRLLTESGDTADDAVSLAKQALSGSSYDRLLLVDPLSKQRGAANDFVDTLATIAMASLEASARKGASSSLDRWQVVLQAAHTAQNALAKSGNTKLVLTELMLAM